LAGLFEENASIFWLFRISQYYEPEDVESLVRDVLDRMLVFPGISHDDFHKLSGSVLPLSGERHVSMLLSKIELAFVSKPYDLPRGLNGTVLFDDVALLVNATEFDTMQYIIEGKSFGILTAICVVLSYYGWSTVSMLRSSNSLAQLSIHSFIMHAGFDFSYGMLLLNIGMSSRYFRRLFLVLFVVMIGLYFIFQVSLISNIWKVNQDLTDADPLELRNEFVRFIGEISAIMFISMFCVVLMLQYPLFPLIFLYSTFIPQILHSMKLDQKKSADSVFTVVTTIVRSFILFYFFVYRWSIAGIHSVKVTIGISVYWVLQAVIILLQNRFGGAFFLPKRFRAVGFQYRSLHVANDTECSICMSPIMEQEEAMVTPCAHFFHSECLMRWMEEQMICPICRARLPPIMDGREMRVN
jgi:hypothetical protein